MSGRIIVHSLAQARAAIGAAAALDVPVSLQSAPGAGAYAGAPWWQALTEAAAAEHPGTAVSFILDCGDDAGAVLAALRLGLRHLRFIGSAAARQRLDGTAAALAAQIEGEAPDATLDLLDQRDPAAACRAFLAGLPMQPEPLARH